MRPYRTLLFVPAHKPEWADKALRAAPDAIVVDLEDSVADHAKAGARQTAGDTIRRLREASSAVGIFVRTNPIASKTTGLDLEAAVVPGLDGVFIPKTETPADIHGLDALVDYFEARSGLSGLEYIIPIETPSAIHNCREIALASPRVGAMVGPTAEHADIARAVGYQWTPEGLETLYLRSRVLLACREAGIHALTCLWERLDDLDGLRAFSRQGRQLGYRGMIVIHPSHVATVNAVFSPSADEIDYYRGLVATYETAAARGEGAVRYRGAHIDKAHYDTALDWLTHAANFAPVEARDSVAPSAPVEAVDSAGPSAPVEAGDPAAPSAPVATWGSAGPSAPVQAEEAPVEAGDSKGGCAPFGPRRAT
jgi:citrate lyase subunit beta/citryl-CoA lyase